MNGYIAFYNGSRIEVYADASYQAQQQALQEFKKAGVRIPKSKQYMVSVVLAERDGKQITHSTAGI